MTKQKLSAEALPLPDFVNFRDRENPVTKAVADLYRIKTNSVIHGLLRASVAFKPVRMVCSTHGEYIGYEMYHRGEHKTFQDCLICPECLKAQREKEREEMEERARQAMEEMEKEKARLADERNAIVAKQALEARDKEVRAREELYTKSRIPIAYRGVRFADIVEHDRSVTEAKSEAMTLVKHLPELMDEGVNLCFYGKAGTGKTMLACAILNEVYERYPKASIAFMEAREMISLQIAAWKADDDSEFERLIGADVLVIDELGVQLKNDLEEGIFISILNKRYGEKKITVFTTNLNPSSFGGSGLSLATALGVRVFERVRQNTRFLSFLGNSQRRSVSSLASRVKTE